MQERQNIHSHSVYKVVYVVIVDYCGPLTNDSLIGANRFREYNIILKRLTRKNESFSLHSELSTYSCGCHVVSVSPPRRRVGRATHLLFI